MRRVWRMMIVPSGSTDRHGHTTSRQHDEGDVHDDGQTRDSTNEIVRPMCDSTAYSHTRFIRRPSSFVHSACSGCNRKRCSWSSGYSPSSPSCTRSEGSRRSATSQWHASYEAGMRVLLLPSLLHRARCILSFSGRTHRRVAHPIESRLSR